MVTRGLKLIAGLIILVLSGCGGEAPVEVSVGAKAPAFALQGLDGQKVKSDSYDGDLVVLNFWATWCQNCKKELPDLKELAKTTNAKVVGIALDEGGAKTVKPFVKKNDINYTVLIGNERVFNRFKGIAIPYTLVLDREQRIVEIFRGPIPKGSLEETLKKLS